MGKRLHFILVPYPAQGHLSPMFHLAKLLAEQEAAVTLLNIDPIHKQLQRQQHFHSNINLAGIPFSLDTPVGVDSSWYFKLNEFSKALSDSKTAFESVLRDVISSSLPDKEKLVFVADFFMVQYTQVAEQFSISCARYWPGSAAWLSIHYHLPLASAKGDVPVQDAQKVVDYVPGLSPLKLLDFPKYVQPGSPEFVGGRLLSSSDTGLKGSWVLVNSTYELETQCCEALRNVLGDRVIPIGPLFTASDNRVSSLRTEAVHCIKWLAEQPERSVLYVSFGSIATLSEEEFTALAAGLEASKQRFLWVLREELIPSKSADFFRGFLRRTSEQQQGIIVGWAPQLQVLSHEAVAGFLSHCGWNSLFESIACGVPVLGCPCISEQRLNCKLAVDDWKIGTRLDLRTAVDAEKTIHAFVARLSVLRDRVLFLQGLTKAAATDGGSSDKSLDYFLRGLSP